MGSSGMWIFQLWGVVSMANIGICGAWLLIHYVRMFSDASSSFFIASPEAVTAAAALVCVVIGGTFVVIHKTVADTLLFCVALDARDRVSRGLSMFGPRFDHIPFGLRKHLE